LILVTGIHCIFFEVRSITDNEVTLAALQLIQALTETNAFQDEFKTIIQKKTMFMHLSDSIETDGNGNKKIILTKGQVK
jgi:hypothetical protein